MAVSGAQYATQTIEEAAEEAAHWRDHQNTP